MNPRNKRPTASDLIPTGKTIKEMSYEEMEVFYSQRKERCSNTSSGTTI
jgi:hypothetical protein